MYSEIESFIKEINPLLDSIPITIGMANIPDGSFTASVQEGANMLIVHEKYDGDTTGLLETLILLWGMTNGMVERKEFQLLAEKEKEIKQFLNRDPLGIRDEED